MTQPEPPQNTQPPWSQWRLFPSELEDWIRVYDGQEIRWARGVHIPLDTPLPQLRKRLERAMRRRGGIARVWELDGYVRVYLSTQTPAWKGFADERAEPLH